MSKNVFQRELQNPGIARRQNLAVTWAVHRGIRIAESRVIHQVERLATKIDSPTLGERERPQ
jgi:hypothetical protein